MNSTPNAFQSEAEGPVAAAAVRRRMHAPATRALTGSIIVGWIVQLGFGWSDEAPNLTLAIQLGANFSFLVQEGQLDRLVTANWLHGYWFHLILNAVGLWVLGRAVEQLLGARRVFIVFVIASLGGATASAWAHAHMPSMGASTGIAGLFGALGVILFGLRSRLPRQAARLRRSWLFVLGLQIILETWMETPLSPLPGVQIDHAGHLGGFAAGGVTCAALLLAGGLATRAGGGSGSRFRWIVPTLLGAMITASFFLAGFRVLSGDTSAFHHAIDAAVDKRFPPSVQNLYAWEIAISPNADRPLLSRGVELSKESLRRFEEEVAIVGTDENRRAWWAEWAANADTQATLLFRLGHVDEAIRVERQALGVPVELPSQLRASIHSQLARFYSARIRSSGALIETAVPSPTFASETGKLIYQSAPLTGPLELFVVAERTTGHTAGLIHIQLGPGERLPHTTVVPALPAELIFTVALASAGSPQPWPQKAGVEWAPLDRTVAAYPHP